MSEQTRKSCCHSISLAVTLLLNHSNFRAVVTGCLLKGTPRQIRSRFLKQGNDTWESEMIATENTSPGCYKFVIATENTSPEYIEQRSVAFRTLPSLSSDRSTRDAPSEGDILEAVAVVHGEPEGIQYLQWANGKYSVLMDPNQPETPMFERVGDLTKTKSKTPRSTTKGRTTDRRRLCGRRGLCGSLPSSVQNRQLHCYTCIPALLQCSLRNTCI